MVFPGFIFQTETGIITQLSSIGLIFISYAISRWKKFTFVMLTLTCLLVSFKAFSFAIGPGMNHHPPMNEYNNNWMYYGMPMGVPPNINTSPWGHHNRPWYPYPNLPFHTTFPPAQNFYFQQHSPSNPYMPSWMLNCPHCMQQHRQHLLPPPQGHQSHPLPMS